MKDETSQSVSAKVREYLRECRPGGITLDVIDDQVRKEPSWWYVPLRLSNWPPKMFEYYEALADLEGALEEREQLKVLLVPTEPINGAS
jgi:hypothetical protein